MSEAVPLDMIEPEIEPEPSPLDDYHALKPADELGKHLCAWIRGLDGQKTPLIARIRRNHNTYYGMDDGAAGWADDLYPTGQNGEIVRLRVNLARSLVKKRLQMVNGVRPAVEPQAKNSDSVSTKEVEIARSFADDLIETQKLGATFARAAEYADALDMGLVHGRWIDTDGGMYAAPQGPMGEEVPLYRGAVRFTIHSLCDVYWDLSARDWSEIQEFVVVERANRYDLMAEYPEAADKIKSVQAVGFDSDKMALPNPASASSLGADSTAVRKLYYYHRRSPAVPHGVMLCFLDDGTPLGDKQPLPYEDVPLWSVYSARVLDTALGYGTLTELGSSQEAFNKCLSMAATTLFTHGLPNIVVKRSANLDAEQIPGGQKVFEVDDVENPVHVLDLADVPQQVVEFPRDLGALMTQIAGLNKIVQGDPGSIQAATAFALFQAMAQQGAGDLEESKHEGIEKAILWACEATQIHSPDVERFVQLVGKTKRQALISFFGQDLRGFSRFRIKRVNELAKTPSGKLTIAQGLKDLGVPITVDQFMQVINTGTTDPVTEGPVSESDLIRQETELLAEGTPIAALNGQDHTSHILDHLRALHDPEVALQNEALRKNVLEHCYQHLNLHMQGDMLFMASRGLLPPGFANPMMAAMAGAGQPAANDGGGEKDPAAAMRPPGAKANDITKPPAAPVKLPSPPGVNVPQA